MNNLLNSVPGLTYGNITTEKSLCLSLYGLTYYLLDPFSKLYICLCQYQIQYWNGSSCGKIKHN